MAVGRESRYLPEHVFQQVLYRTIHIKAFSVRPLVCSNVREEPSSSDKNI